MAMANTSMNSSSLVTKMCPLDGVYAMGGTGACETPDIVGPWRAWPTLVSLFLTLVVSFVILSYRKARLIRLSQGFAAQFELHEGETLGTDFAVDTPAIDVTFFDVSMRLKTSGLSVLEGVSGHFPAGSLAALMGPSGGGKTTFMNAILGRASYGHTSGRILINGVEGSLGAIPSLVGFVPQDDIVHANLTVYENIYYNAVLRLPRRASKLEKVKHCVQVHSRPLRSCSPLLLSPPLISLHLPCMAGAQGARDRARQGSARGRRLQAWHLGRAEEARQHRHAATAHTCVSRPHTDVRCAACDAGMELVAMPAVIFMDEPTSGLDGAAALLLTNALVRLRESGLTMLCVIHQPRLAVFEAFSHVLLLGRGGKQVIHTLPVHTPPLRSHPSSPCTPRLPVHTPPPSSHPSSQFTPLLSVHTHLSVHTPPPRAQPTSPSNPLLRGRGGTQIYCGLGARIEEYFNSHGFVLPPRESAADWIIDITCGMQERTNTDGSVDTTFEAPRDLFTLWQKVPPHEAPTLPSLLLPVQCMLLTIVF
jgi:ABC-type Mn2+/Zn2+ transport system ATPase subunit